MRYIAIATLLIVTACTSPYANSPRWQADNQACQFEKARVGGYDWADAVLQRAEVYKYCMKSRGW